MSNICQICVENFNKSTKKEIKCTYCDYSACQTCYKQTILNSIKYAGCMNCNKEFEMEFMMINFPKCFINNEYKIHCQTILFEIEKRLLPSTQPIVEKINHTNHIKQEINKLNMEIDEINSKIDLILFETETENITKTNKLNMEIDIIKAKIYDLNQIMNNPPENINLLIKKCENPGCNGYLNQNWKCGICEKVTCCKCHDFIESEYAHVCDNQTIESIQFINKDSKTCPGCSIIIHKIDGCNQIYCTNCKTAFDWETGRIEKGVIHNPHFYQEIRERSLLDIIQCGREIDNSFLKSFHKLYDKMNIDFSQMEVSLQNIHYIQYYILPRFYIGGFNNNQDLRIRFLQNELSEKQFKQALFTRKRRVDKNKEISTIIHTFLTSVIDLFHRFKHDLRKFLTKIENLNMIKLQAFYDIFYIELDNLVLYINSCFENVQKKYKSKRKYHITSFLFTFYTMKANSNNIINIFI